MDGEGFLDSPPNKNNWSVDLVINDKGPVTVLDIWVDLYKWGQSEAKVTVAATSMEAIYGVWDHCWENIMKTIGRLPPEVISHAMFNEM